MQIRLFGIAIIFSVCVYLGIQYANTYRRDASLLRQLCLHIETMICMLRQEQSTLPEVFTRLEQEASSPLNQVFWNIGQAFAQQLYPDAGGCMASAISKVRNLPSNTREALTEFGHTLGRFDLDGQIRGAETVLQRAKDKLAGLERNADQRIRTYRAFGLCAGAALAILLI